MGLSEGSITVICGPMFAGKTQTLLKHVSRWKTIPQVATCLVKHCRDTRARFDRVSTHDGVTRKADFVTETMAAVVEFVETHNIDVVAIDEGKPSLATGKH